MLFWLVLLVPILSLYVVFSLRAGEEQKACAEALHPGEYPFRNLLPAAFLMVDQFKLHGMGSYHHWLHRRIVAIYGTRYATFHEQAHFADKVFQANLGWVLACVLGMLGGLGGGWLLLAPVVAVVMYFLADQGLENRWRERKTALILEFPVFLGNLVLLLQAGMHIRPALERIQEETAGDAPLYAELATVLGDISAGVSEVQAWNGFSERCAVPEFTRFVSLLQQQMKLGGAQWVFELGRQATEAWEMRKNTARRLAETASTKLVFPLCLMFLGILMICVAPAFLSIRGW